MGTAVKLGVEAASVSPVAELSTSGSEAVSGLPDRTALAAVFSYTLKPHGAAVVMDGALFTWPMCTVAEAVVVSAAELPCGAPESLSASVSE